MTRRPSFADVEQLITQAILPFYSIERDLSVPLAKRRLENDAEHSWSIALVACALAPHVDKTLDIGKVCQFAVVHDLAELHAGDVSAVAPIEEQQTKEERERQALVLIKKQFQRFPWLIKTLEEYERQEAPEALFVRSVDKTVALHLLYLDKARHDYDKQMTLVEFAAIIEHQRSKARAHAGAFVYYEEIHAALLAHPEYFYQKS